MINLPLEKMYFDHHKDTERHSGNMLKTERQAFLKKNVGQNNVVLDIGCRNGELTKAFVEDNTVTGVDIDSHSLELAKRFGIKTQQLDLNGDWPFQSESFDVVVATEVIEHVYHPALILQKVHKVLKPGGKLVGSVPNAFSLKNRVRLFFAKKKYTPLGDPTHINHFSRKELLGLLKSQFKEATIEPLGKYAWLDRFFPGMFSFMFQFIAKK